MERSASLNLQQDSPMVDEMFDAGAEMEMSMEKGAPFSRPTAPTSPARRPPRQ